MTLGITIGESDVLADVLGRVRLQGRVFCCADLSAPWSLALPGGPDVHFHVVEHGGGYLRIHGEGGATALGSGDLVIVMGGGGHVLSDGAGVPAVPLGQLVELGGGRRHRLRHGGGGAETRLVCGAFRFEAVPGDPLLGVLPAVLHVRAERARGWLAPALDLLMHEARHPGPGSEMLLTRLTDVVFVQAVRAWVEEQPKGHGGWLGALRDPQIGAALGLIHRQSGRPWTVASLAREVALSRSPFAARFTALVGEPPLAYLTRWRMLVAADLLRRGELHVGEVGRRVGYESEPAFSKAFRRWFGAPPVTYRRHLGAALPARPEPDAPLSALQPLPT